MELKLQEKTIKDIRSSQLTDRSEGLNLKPVFGIPVNKLSAGFKAKNFYTKKHNQPGLKGLQETVDLLLDKGCYHQDGDILVLWSQGYRVVIALESLKIINYDTLHHERTLAQVRAGVASKAKGGELDYKGLIRKLDDDTIDRIKIPYKLVKKISEDTGLGFSEVHDLVRDSIADALDYAEKELKEVGEEKFLKSSTYYAQVESRDHLLSTSEIEILLRKDGLRVKEIKVLDLDLE